MGANRDKVQDKREQKRLRGEQQLAQDRQEKSRGVIPITGIGERQKHALQNFPKCQLSILTGPAGTGKTELACNYASVLWDKGIVDNIIIARANKTLGKDGGAVKGGDTEKLLNFVMSMLEKFRKHLGANVLKNNLRMDEVSFLFEAKRGIQVVPIEKIQGRSFDNRTVLLIDEAQNCDIAQTISYATRAEEGCKVIVMGDPAQSAIPSNNGLDFLLKLLNNHPSDQAVVTEFLPEDCQRKGIAAHITQVIADKGHSWRDIK